jgi:uncharacterized membrane protein
MIIVLAIHLLAALVWVGGMFFAYVILRPSAAALAPEVRLPLWRRVYGRFFACVWISVATLAVSGFALAQFLYGSFAALSPIVHAMLALGLIMMVTFAFVYFVPWRRFRAAVDAAKWPQAAAQLNQIRRLVAANLVLGTLTVLVGIYGLYQ